MVKAEVTWADAGIETVWADTFLELFQKLQQTGRGFIAMVAEEVPPVERKMII